MRFKTPDESVYEPEIAMQAKESMHTDCTQVHSDVSQPANVRIQNTFWILTIVLC